MDITTYSINAIIPETNSTKLAFGFSAKTLKSGLTIPNIVISY